jgi:hypothetical protein
MRVRVRFGVNVWDLLTDIMTQAARTQDAYGFTVRTHSPLPLRRLRTSYDPFGAGAGGVTALIHC